MDYEDIDRLRISRDLGYNQLVKDQEYNASKVLSAAASQSNPCDVYSLGGRHDSNDPDKLSVVYASVCRGNKNDDSGLTSLSADGSYYQHEETNKDILYAKVKKDFGVLERQQGAGANIQLQSDQPGGYYDIGSVDTWRHDVLQNQNPNLLYNFGSFSHEADIYRDSVYSLAGTDTPGDGLYSGASGNQFKNIYEFERPVHLPSFRENAQLSGRGSSNGMYEEIGSPDFGYGMRPSVDRGRSGIYSVIRSDRSSGCLSSPMESDEAFLPSGLVPVHDRSDRGSMSLTGAICSRCHQGFSREEEIVNSSGQIWHTKCFVCVQCFQQFPDGVFYEFEGRKYCEHDFNVLFAPCCGRCKEFIIGRVIKAMNFNWHPDCFVCQLCSAPLADAGFIKNAGRALCRECNAKEKARGTGKYVCHKCHSIIEDGHIKYKGEAYHPYHFNCTTCSVELNADAREKGGELYCLRCHDKMGIPICGACRRPVEERVVYSLGKAWHVEHFVCAKCEKPFLGTRHYEKKGLAYCETHYHQLFGNICFICNCVVAGDVFTALNKAWCVDHFACSVCDRKMSQKTKFFEVDLKPVCKTCYEKFPAELKKRLKKAYDQQMKK